MSLQLNRETGAGKRPVILKVFELFTGGFSYLADALDTFTSGRELPQGTLLRIAENTRTAIPVKRGRLLETIASSISTGLFEPGHMFEAGDRIQCGGTATIVESVTEGNDGDTIVCRDRFRKNLQTAAGSVAYHVGSTSATGPGGLTATGIANAIAAYPSTIETTASVTALRRGTVYANRIQPVNEGYDIIPATIILSTSR